MTTLNASMGVVDESTYGTPVTVTRFFPVESVQFSGLEPTRIESKAIQAGDLAPRSTHWAVGTKKPTARVTMPVLTKQWGFWLKHCLGSVSSGTVVDSNYTHSGVLASLIGDMFTAQFNMPLHPAGTDNDMTFHGGKVASWELACASPNDHVKFTANLDFEDYDTTTSLAATSYASDTRLFAGVAVAVEIADTVVSCRSFKVAVDNKLKTDRFFLGSSLKSQPTPMDKRAITWSAELEFESLTQLDRVRSSTTAGALAKIEFICDGPIAHAGTTLPRLYITMPAARFDKGDVGFSNPDGLLLPLSGIAMGTTATDAIDVTYRSTDVTP